MTIDILWMDEALVVVNKPGGVPSQSDQSGDLDVLTALTAQLGGPGIGLVHRLDRPVSGALIFARTPSTLATLNAQFRTRIVQKTYWAIVEGKLEGTRRLENRLVHDPRERKTHVHTPGATDHRTAVLHVESMVVGARYSLVQVIPEGGAFHQIRAQLGASGHAIKGDVKYGARRGEADRTIALHARSLVVQHPATRTSLTVEAPPPSNSIWPQLLAGMGGMHGLNSGPHR